MKLRMMQNENANNLHSHKQKNLCHYGSVGPQRKNLTLCSMMSNGPWSASTLLRSIATSVIPFVLSTGRRQHWENEWSNQCPDIITWHHRFFLLRSWERKQEIILFSPLEKWNKKRSSICGRNPDNRASSKLSMQTELNWLQKEQRFLVNRYLQQLCIRTCVCVCVCVCLFVYLAWISNFGWMKLLIFLKESAYPTVKKKRAWEGEEEAAGAAAIRFCAPPWSLRWSLPSLFNSCSLSCLSASSSLRLLSSRLRASGSRSLVSHSLWSSNRLPTDEDGHLWSLACWIKPTTPHKLSTAADATTAVVSPSSLMPTKPAKHKLS